MTHGISRRALLASTAAARCSAALCVPALGQGAGGRVVVIGGVFAGATCARFLKRMDPRLIVTLVEASPVFVACPLSNSVIAGLRDIAAQKFTLHKLPDDAVDRHT